MNFDKLRENRQKVDATIVKAAFFFAPFILVLITIGYLRKYSFATVIIGSIIFLSGCLVPKICSKINSKYLSHIAIISFTIISSTIYYLGHAPGLIILFFIPIGIACCYFNKNLLRFAFVSMVIGIIASLFLLNIKNNGIGRYFLITLATDITFVPLLCFIVYLFFRYFVQRANNIFNDEMKKEELLSGVNLQVNNTTHELIEVAKSLEVQSSESSGGTEQIAAEINDMLAGVKKQTESIDNVYQKLLIAQKGIDDIQDNVKIIKDNSLSTQALADNGITLIQKSGDKDVDVIGSIQAAQQKVNYLCSNIDTIFKFVDKVQSIASQTKLLSVNASIEASRAGESGKGFNIVAKEVSKLAAQTARTVKEVHDMLVKFKEESIEVADTMEHTKTTVEEGVNLSREVSKQFSTITKRNIDINNNIVNLSDNVQKQLVTPIETIAENLSNIRSSIHLHNNAINGVASVSEELTTMTEEITILSANLVRISNSLGDLLRE